MVPMVILIDKNEDKVTSLRHVEPWKTPREHHSELQTTVTKFRRKEKNTYLPFQNVILVF